MYDFIYVVFYRICKLGTDIPKEAATIILTLIIWVQILLVPAVIKFFFGINVLAFIVGDKAGKYIWVLPLFLLMNAVEKKYEKRGEEVLSKYENKKMITPINIAFAILNLVVPLFIIIYISSNSE